MRTDRAGLHVSVVSGSGRIVHTGQVGVAKNLKVVRIHFSDIRKIFGSGDELFDVNEIDVNTAGTQPLIILF